MPRVSRCSGKTERARGQSEHRGTVWKSALNSYDQDREVSDITLSCWTGLSKRLEGVLQEDTRKHLQRTKAQAAAGGEN